MCYMYSSRINLFTCKACKKKAIGEQCTVAYCIDLGESFQMSIYFQKSASIEPRTNPVKFARGGPVEGSPQLEPALSALAAAAEE